ncbi:CD27 antigen-like [Brachionichthys hirsutus]|uniref:CD27 antigen-like n=1 Tax=Brachionichthys hirsutus TaxID=412623 RepID=UPI0036043A40
MLGFQNESSLTFMNNLLSHFWSTFSLTLRGSQVTSPLTFPSMMQPLHYFAFTLLCSLSFLSSVLSIQCKETQYPWPAPKPEFCCDMCRPGKYLASRSRFTCEKVCEDCKGKRYRDAYNVELTCKFCENCDRPNMDYKSDCNASRNAECRCKAGYECKEHPCKQCVPIPTTKPPPSTAGTDTVWSLVIIGLLSAGMAVILVTKIKPFLHWIRLKHDSLLADSGAIPVAPCSKDEDVSKPVQEAGNATKIKSDPELGLMALLQADRHSVI